MIILWRILPLSIQDSDPIRRDLLSQHFLTGGEEQHIPSGMDTVSGTWWTQCSYCKWSFGCGSIDPLMSMMSIVTDPLLPVWHRETCFQHLKALTGWKFPIRLHGDEIREHSSAMFSCVYGCNATSEKLRDLEQEAGVKMRLEKHPRPIRKGAVSTPSVVFLLARHFTPQCLIFCKPMHATAFRKWAPSVSLWL